MGNRFTGACDAELMNVRGDLRQDELTRLEAEDELMRREEQLLEDAANLEWQQQQLEEQEERERIAEAFQFAEENWATCESCGKLGLEYCCINPECDESPFQDS
ncbi:hypothetical protein [Halosolutus gelatinilyticus]|uniref:hypothetical protein n=1 Tax=Halosolutus gelatinilyticus TaxID=2931975 RepID=UPI001FF4867E|nr:hypothetical protein [Halosolutus gelatinilyticus]